MRSAVGIADYAQPVLWRTPVKSSDLVCRQETATELQPRRASAAYGEVRSTTLKRTCWARKAMSAKCQ
jgi:hypothetical protein